MNLADILTTSINEINNEIQEIYSQILPQLAQEIFDSGGKTHGRNWQPNAPSTIKRKKADSRNIETGLLRETLMQPGFLENDDYMDRLPKQSAERDYQYANDTNGGINRFDDIGRTPDDEKWIEEQIEKAMESKYG